MNPDRWTEAETLFHRLIELEPEECAQVLADVRTSDPELAVYVASLLSGHRPDGAVDRLGAALGLAPLRPAAPGDRAGEHVGQYRILELAGRGGMGDVYRARDERLERDVALKFLPPWISQEPAAMERFLVEARAIAALDHPAICAIHEMGEAADGALFMALPFYEGETLQARLARGPLPVQDAVRIALDAARGLAAAHARGIIHRDIKPGNLFLVHGGGLKILDFGIAKLADVHLTRTGEVPGTFAYMSPEQATGSAVDASTDLWSLGVVLHEMLTGTLPAIGSGPAAGLPGPPRLASLLRRMLEPLRADRINDAAAVAAELEAILAERGGLRSVRATLAVVALVLLAGSIAAVLALRDVGRGGRDGGTTVSTDDIAVAPGVAVLPFHVAGPELELLEEGLVILLSVNIDGIGELRRIDPQAVISNWTRRVAATPTLDRRQAALTVARDLGATFAITGSAVRTPTGGRLTAEAYDVADGRLRGARSVDGSVDSLHVLADRLTLELVRHGLIPASDEAAIDLARITTASPAALKAYLAGERAYQRGLWREAAALFEQAVADDSLFARAHFRLGGSYAWLTELAVREKENLQRALRFSDRATPRDALLMRAAATLDLPLLETFTRRYPDDADGWFLLGDKSFHQGGVLLRSAQAFRTALQHAIALAPRYAESYQHLIEDAAVRLDSARMRELLQLASEADVEPCVGHRLAYDLAWGGAEAEARARAALDTIDYDALGCGWTTLALAPAAVERMETLDRARIRAGLPLGVQLPALWRSLQARMMRGEILAARAVLAHARSVPDVQRDVARFVVMFHLSGYADPEAVAGALDLLAREPTPEDNFWIGAFAAAEGRWSDVEAAARAIEAAPRTPIDEDGIDRRTSREKYEHGFAAALREYARLLRGGADLASFELALSQVPRHGWRGEYPGKYLRYQVARLLLERNRHEAAQRYLESFYQYDWVYYVPAQLFLGEIHQAAGRTLDARAHYERVVGWWGDADAELQPLRQQALDALARLSTDTPRGR